MAKRDILSVLRNIMDKPADERDVIFDYEDDDFDEDDYDSNGIPFGCRACGGDYPHCKQGCSLFDDE